MIGKALENGSNFGLFLLGIFTFFLFTARRIRIRFSPGLSECFAQGINLGFFLFEEMLLPPAFEIYDFCHGELTSIEDFNADLLGLGLADQIIFARFKLCNQVFCQGLNCVPLIISIFIFSLLSRQYFK